MTTTEALKLCPLCGSAAESYSTRESVGAKFWHRIRCVNHCCHIELTGRQTEDEAIAAWNRRATASIEQQDHIEDKLDMVAQPADPILPPMPDPLYRHPKLGAMFDRMQMHFYAAKHAEGMTRLLDAAQVARQSIDLGWKIVPIDPTMGMVVDGFEAVSEFRGSEECAEMSGCQASAEAARICYRTMLAASPNPQMGLYDVAGNTREE